MSGVVRARALAASGAELLSDLLIPSGTWTKVTTLTVRPGYPDTQLVSDSQIMSGSGSGTFTGRIGFNLASGTQQFKIQVNGSDVGSPVTKNTISNIASGQLSPGDVVDLYAFASINVVAARTVSGGTSTTYLYFTPS